jgi:transaldolase
MTTPLQSLVATGTKLWLDSVDPKAITESKGWGASGATSNPIIISGIISRGLVDKEMATFMRDGLSDEDVAWRLTDLLVKRAQEVFMPTWEATRGDDGYVSFELDPLIEDPHAGISVAEGTRRYIELGKKWSAGHKNRMIKIPNTDAGIGALEELAAAGVTLNVTLTFSPRQYIRARDAVWRGAQKRKSLEQFKSVYSIFVSRLDVYTWKHDPHLSAQAQGQVGIVNAKEIWKMNQDFWADKKLPLKQEIIFASTGVKVMKDLNDGRKPPEFPPWNYVAAFAGSDIETNPPETNQAIEKPKPEELKKWGPTPTFTRQVDKLPPKAVVDEIHAKVDPIEMERRLMEEGIEKFADPHKALLKLIGEKRRTLKG